MPSIHQFNAFLRFLERLDGRMQVVNELRVLSVTSWSSIAHSMFYHSLTLMQPSMMMVLLSHAKDGGYYNVTSSFVSGPLSSLRFCLFESAWEQPRQLYEVALHNR
jgi:hypothetical protein